MGYNLGRGGERENEEKKFYIYIYIYICTYILVNPHREERALFSPDGEKEERERRRGREREREDRQIDVVARAVPRLLVFPDRPGTRVEQTSPHGDRSLLHSSRVTWARDEAREGGG